jgi:hypothetical protein
MPEKSVVAFSLKKSPFIANENRVDRGHLGPVLRVRLHKWLRPMGFVVIIEIASRFNQAGCSQPAAIVTEGSCV